MADVGNDLFRRIQDRVAIVGIGHLPFAKDIGRPIADTAVEAIQLAPDEAGLAAEDVDGTPMLEMAATHGVAIASRKHAQRNPYARMRDRPLDMETYLAGRPIGWPLTFYGCCLETDGALACVVTSLERARDLRQRPVLVHAVAQASGSNPVH